MNTPATPPIARDLRLLFPVGLLSPGHIGAFHHLLQENTQEFCVINTHTGYTSVPLSRVYPHSIVD